MEQNTLNKIYGASGLTVLIKEPVRVTSDTQTLIDHAITNRPDLISGSGVVPREISDHDLIYIIKTSRLPKVKIQGGHKSGKHGKLWEFEKLSKSQGNLNFCRKNLENSGKMKLCDMIANKNAFHRIFLS